MAKIDPRSGLPILTRREMERLDGHELFAYQQRILRHRDRTPLLQSVAEQTQNVMARMIERGPSSQNTERAAQPGYIYIVGGGNSYKIGKSINVPSRLRSFLQLPFKTRLIHVISSSDMAWAESYMHRTFAHCRMNGEWFDLTPNDISWVCAIPSLDPEG